MKRSSAFTLVELVVVITIMTMLGLIAVMAIPYVKTQGQIRQTEAIMKLIEDTLDQYKQDKGSYPTGLGTDMVKSLTDPTAVNSWKRASWDWFPGKKTLTDSWGQSFAYTSNAEYDTSGRGVEVNPNKKNFYNSQRFQLYSMGPNMKTWANTAAGGNNRLCGTERDDIRNWKQIIFYDTNPY